MALYRGCTKVSGIGQSFNPENTGTEGQVLTKTNSGYAYCDPQGGGGSDLYNIKYIVVGGGGAGGDGIGGAGGEVKYGNIGFNDDKINVSIGCYGYPNYNRRAGGPSNIRNSDIFINARGGESGNCLCCYSCSLPKSGSGYVNITNVYSYACALVGGGGAGGPGNDKDGGPGLCGYGGGGASSTGTATDGGGSSGCCAGCGGGGYSDCYGGYQNNGGKGIVKICYACDGSGGINTATGGNSCYVCDGYCVHEFTSDGTFCITG